MLLARYALPLALLVSLALPACGSDSGSVPSTDGAVAGIDAGTAIVDSSTDRAIATAIDTSADGAGMTTARGIVVVSGDYVSSSISFLDPDGHLVKDGCFNSGTSGGGLFPTLSGDVVLPTQIPSGSAPIIVDRGNAVLTWLDPTTCSPVRQLSVSTGFASNPHDIVSLSATKAYVTRYKENQAATAAPGNFDGGDDLLIIDPSQPKILGRIDLKPFAPSASVLPCADHALLAEGKVFVSLNAVSGDFASYGTGRIVIVDPGLDQVAGTIDLPGVKNCGAMTYVAAQKKLLVACDGAYSDGAKQAAGSAIVAIDLGVTPPAVSTNVAASTAGGMPFSNGAIAALDDNTVLAVTVGDVSNSPPDRVWSLSLSGSPSAEVFASTEAFAIGAVLTDPASETVAVADGTTKSDSLLRFFMRASGSYIATQTVNATVLHPLPVRALAWY
jgi:hypothetical protein